MKPIVKPIIKNPNERIELLDLLQEWVKTEQDPIFWNYAKRLNLFTVLLDLPTRKHNFLVRGIVSLVRLAQLKAFHDGIQKGREEKGRERRR